MPVYRSDQFSIGVKVESLPNGAQTDNIPWDSCEGFDNAVEGQTYLPGGMRPQVAQGGIPKRSPGTIKRAWSDPLLGIFKALDSGAGQCPVTVTVATLNNKKEPVPGVAPITYTGVLGTVSRPNYMNTSAETAYLQIMVDADGEIN